MKNAAQICNMMTFTK